jgi:hypothetical protein
MANNIPMPDISPAFTIKDIHKIREWNYERRKDMSRQEIIDDVNAGALEFEALIEAARQQSQSVTPDDIATHNRAMEEYRRGETIEQDAINWA